MPSRTYQVNYDITGVSTEAVKAFEALKAPMSEISTAIKTASENMAILMEQAKAFKAMGKDLVITPKINTKSFADALATMEANVKASSMRMRASLEAALSGSRADHKRVNDLLGTDNWKRAMSEQRHELESLSKKLELLRAARDKYSTGKSTTSELARNRANQTFSGYTDPNKRVADIIKKAGLGNIFTKSGDQWGFAGGDSRAKFKDYIKNLESQEAELKNAISSAKKANEQFFGNVKNETAFNRKGNFVERMLGISPEQLKEIQPTLNTINSLMGGVAQAQEKVQNVTKRTPIPKPVKPTSLPSKKTMRDLKNSISEARQQQAGVWARDNEIQSWQRLEDAGKLNEFGRKNLEKLKKQRAIWAASQNEGTAPNQKIQELTNQYSAYQKQRAEYAKQLVDWRKRPYTETTEQITTGVTQAQKAASQPIKLNVTGNFAKQIQPLLKLSSALTAIPKAPVDVAVNVSISSGAVTGLEAIKKNLQAINAARGKIAKGGVSNIEKLAATARGEVKKNPITSRVGVDGSAANSELAALIQTLKEQAAKNLISLKAVIDIKGVKGELSTIISELKKKAREAGISIKAKLDVSGISKPFTEKIAALKRQATKSNLSIKAKLDSTKMSTDLRKKIKALKDIATKNPIKLRATIDTSMIAKDLNKAIANTGKNPLKNMPSIKVTLDTSEATAALNKLLTSIKAASPQNIKLGATTGGAAKGKAAGAIGSAVTAPVNNTTPRISTRGISTAAATAAAIRNATPSKRPGVIDRLRKSLYPLTGNVSLGASTPVALDMAKGMGVMYGVGGAMNLVTGGLTDAMEYQNTMETAEEILKRNYSGKNFGKDFKDMATEVRRVAKQTKFTAPQAADATRFMAMAGLSVPMIKASVSPIADVAVIGDNDFGEVADKMTNIQTAFQIQPNKMRHTADALTNTFTHTNTDMTMLAESMQYAAPMAHLTGMSLDDTLAMVGIMGNSGIQASMAGTTLRMMMQNTLNPNKGQAALWKKLGVNTRDSSGNLRNMIDILADVKVAQKGSGLTMADVVSNLFRVTASAGAVSLIENIDDVKKLALQNRGIGNVSEEISERKQNTVKGMWAQMTSAFTEANLQVFEQFQGDIIGMIKAVRDYFSSKEAVENLRSAFELIKDLMGLFGEIAKAWMSVYNKFNGFIKFIIKAQFVVAQFGYMLKPIMSLVNVFGGLKSLAVGFVSALSGGAAIKKAATGLASVVATSGRAATTSGTALAASQYVSRHTTLKPLAPTAIEAANLAAYTPYPVVASKMGELERKRMFYVMKGNRLRNSIQKAGSLAREAVNPFVFGSLSMFNPKDKNDIKYMGELMKNRSAMTNLYLQYPYQRAAMLRAYQKVAFIDSEMRDLKMDNFVRNKKLSQARTYSQLSNIPLLYRYNRMHQGVDNEATRRYAEYRKLRREEQIGNIALMSRLRYSSFYHPGKNADVDNYFANRISVLRENSKARRPQQIGNIALMYRAAKVKGKWMAAMKFGFKDGMANALTLHSMIGFWSSIKHGIISVTSAIARGLGMLIGPVGLAASGLALVAGSAYLIYKNIQKEKERIAKNNKNNAAIRKQAANLYGSYADNVKAVENGIATFRQKNGKPLKSYVAPIMLGTSHKAKRYGILEKNFAAINAITSDIQDTSKARLIFDQYVKPNFELMDGDGSFAGKVLTKNFNNSLSNDAIRENADDVMNAGGFAPGAKLPGSQNTDLSRVKKQAAVAQIYRMGAASKEAMDARKKIYEIYRNAKDLKEAKDKSYSLINELFGANSAQAIGETDANYASYNEITKATNLSSYKQYRWGAQNSLLNWINNSNGTKLGYFEGMMKLKEKFVPYTTEWQDAMSKILSTMQLTFQDAKGKVQQVSMKFSQYGTPLWNTLYDQLKKLHIDFGHSFNDHLSVLAEILKQMWNNPELQQYIKEIGGIREWLMKEAMKLRDIQGGFFKDATKQTETNSWAGQKGYGGEYSKEEYEKYRTQYLKDNGYTSTPLTYKAWKRAKQDEAKSPVLQDIKKRKEVANAVDSKLKNDESLQSMKKLEDIQNGLDSLGNSGAGDSSTSPLAAAKDTNKSLGNHHNQGSVSARPTQINIRVDKLANFDKIQFLKGEEKDMAEALQRAVAEAVSNIVPMMDSLVSNDKMVTA